MKALQIKAYRDRRGPIFILSIQPASNRKVDRMCSKQSGRHM